MATKLPWYILPIYPALALSAGVILAKVFDWPYDRPFPRSWFVVFFLISVFGVLACIYFSFFAWSDRSLLIISASITLTIATSLVLLARRDSQFVLILFWGMYFSALLFFTSNYWVWELNEAFPVKPVAALVRLLTPTDQVVYTSFDYERNSLNFYSDRRVVPANFEELKGLWRQEKQPYFLLDEETAKQLKLSGVQVVGKSAPNWLLITKTRMSKQKDSHNYEIN